MKKMYEKPMAFEEAFVADEYVAACYFLACKRVEVKDGMETLLIGIITPNTEATYLILH